VSGSVLSYEIEAGRRRVTGVVLAGGKSRRMGGEPKALLPFGGRPLIQHIVESLESVLPGCLVVTNTPELYAFLGRRMVADVFPEGGSLGGLYAGLLASGTPSALCVACDMPFVSPAFFAYLSGRAGEADVVIPEAAGELQPLHAVYGRGCLPAMERQLRANRLKVIGFLDEVRVLTVPAATVAGFRDPELLFMNLNTPEDLASARARWPAP
jgi:molybdenum cofactor guanylyltransferase